MGSEAGTAAGLTGATLAAFLLPKLSCKQSSLVLFTSNTSFTLINIKMYSCPLILKRGIFFIHFCHW